MVNDNIDTSECFVCAEPGETDEHVIPTWLQHKYNLWDQRLTLPNHTTMPYRQLRIRACKNCNNVVFSQLEDRIKTDSATEADVWKWACKIHYGLGYKDRVLEWDRKNPGKKIADIVSSNDPFAVDRLFLRTVNGDFNTNPSPFGSVFKFTFDQDVPFTFWHLFPSSSVCITTGNIGYVVFIKDAQVIKNDKGWGAFYLKLANERTLGAMLFFYANCLENFARHKMGFYILKTPTALEKLSSLNVGEKEPFNKERLKKICAFMGLDWREG